MIRSYQPRRRTGQADCYIVACRHCKKCWYSGKVASQMHIENRNKLSEDKHLQWTDQDWRNELVWDATVGWMLGVSLAISTMKSGKLESTVHRKLDGGPEQNIFKEIIFPNGEVSAVDKKCNLSGNFKKGWPKSFCQKNKKSVKLVNSCSQKSNFEAKLSAF